MKKWQCFVCGEYLEEYELFVHHIIAEHDEGRDYILCPVDICRTPIRDLKMHFKAKHPNRPIPQNCQLKATIWRYFSGKKKRTKKPVFKDGWFESQKMLGQKMFYRSGYELDVYKCLEADNDVKAFYVEPFKVPYYFNNEWHNYIPDIKVEFIDGATQVWEIKPKTQLKYEQNKAKWHFMNEYANKLGWEFTVITETGINLLKRKIKQQN